MSDRSHGLFKGSRAGLFAPRAAPLAVAVLALAILAPAVSGSHQGPTPIQDWDHDGWPNGIEFIFGTHQNNPNDQPADLGDANVFFDSDGDGWSDAVESLLGTDPEDESSTPTVPQNPSVDTDSDGWPDLVEAVLGSNPQDGNDMPTAPQDSDGDGFLDDRDNCPANPNSTQADLDGDGLGDACDVDMDGDGYNNSDDAFPRDASEWADFDNDGVGDNRDPDDDGDGVPDNEDAFPYDFNEQHDQDNDGIGDRADPDRDGDGVPNSEDRWPNDPSRAHDADNDGTPDETDRCPGHPDGIDQDYDRIPDACDDDRDGDGRPNATDAWPDDFYRQDPDDPPYQPEGEEAEPDLLEQTVEEAESEANAQSAPAQQAARPVVKSVSARLNETTGVVDILYSINEDEQGNDADRYAVYRSDSDEPVSEQNGSQGQPAYRGEDRSNPEGNVTYIVVPVYDTENGTIEGNGTESDPVEFEPFPEENAGPIRQCKLHDLDSDWDAICDAAEQTLGTDPLNADTDGDGIPDAIELRQGTIGPAATARAQREAANQGNSDEERAPLPWTPNAEEDNTFSALSSDVTPVLVTGILGFGIALLAISAWALWFLRRKPDTNPVA